MALLAKHPGIKRLRRSRFVRAIVYYKCGSIWVFAWPSAYANGNSVKEWQEDLLGVCDFLSGHDSREDFFEYRRQGAVKVEFIPSLRSIDDE